MTKNVLKLSDQAVNLMEKRMELNDAGEDDEWSVPIQEAIQESCREARTAEADTEKKGEDETDIELLLEEHDMFLEEMDQEPSRNQENTPREPDDIDDYQNNNKQQVAESVEVRQAQAAAEEAEKPGQADLDDSSTELDNRRTEFFPEPQSKNAKNGRKRRLCEATKCPWTHAKNF